MEEPRDRPAIERYLTHVRIPADKSQCWIWIGAGKGNGYGNVRVRSKNISAHRRAYELFFGDVPDGKDVCHSCDVRFCVNPDHLFLGSRAENVADMMKKGRGAGPHKVEIREHMRQERDRLETKS